MKKNLIVLFLALASLSTKADGLSGNIFEWNGLYYDVILYNNKLCCELVYNEEHPYAGDITIPAKVFRHDEPIDMVRIGQCAFSGRSNKKNEKVTSVTIEPGVVSIESRAFERCSQLTTVTIPSSVTKIGSSAFQDCPNLVSVNIPNAITTIYGGSFCRCKSLTSITIPSSVETIGSCAFAHSGITSIDLPNNLKIIEDGAFWDTPLKTITIPSGVKDIANYTFMECIQLTSVVSTNTMSVGDMVFYQCSNLIDIPSIKSIGGSAFQGCTALTNISLAKGLTNIADGAFRGCTSLTSISIPEGVTTIGSNAFNGCEHLSTIQIPETITSVGSNAFVDTPWFLNQPNGLLYIGKIAYKYIGTMPENTSISIIDGTLEISGHAFSNCQGLVSVNIPETVNIIGESAFASSGLLSVQIPESVVAIGDSTFASCKNLASVSLPSSITEIPNGMFFDCLKLTAIDFPAGLLRIGISAFRKSGLTSIVLPKQLTTIADYAFSNCAQLSTASIQSHVLRSIGYAAFGYCSNLKSIYFYLQLPQICTGQYMFEGCPEDMIIYIPMYTKYDYSSKNGWERYKNHYVEFDVTSISNLKVSKGISIKNDKGSLTISGLNDNEEIQVYDVSGVLIGSAIATAGTAILNVRTSNHIIVLKIGKKSIKVKL